MNDTRLLWTILTPLIAGLAAAILWTVPRSKLKRQEVGRWLDIAALVVICGGLLIEGLLLALAEGSLTVAGLGLTLTLSAPARLMLIAANTALLAALFLGWYDEQELEAHSTLGSWVALAAMLTSSLLAAGLLVQDRVISVLCLLGPALAVATVAVARPRRSVHLEGDAKAQQQLARRVAGGLKGISLASVGTGLIVAGALAVARYPLNLGDRGLLQLGLALIATGLLVRVGAMPFAAPSADLVGAAPGAAAIWLGAVTPAIVVAGLLWLAPIEGSLRSSSAAWLGAAAALLAGIRALWAVAITRRSAAGAADTDDRRTVTDMLCAMSIALATGWALFGVLSGSQVGAAGAVMLSVNIALAVPLLVASSRLCDASAWSRVGTALGAASLLGAPLLGGFSATVRIAQAAANASGILLAALLAGTLLVAAGWVATAAWRNEQPEIEGLEEAGAPFQLDPLRVLIAVLIVTQLALFLASGQIAASLASWIAGAPWVSGFF